MDRMKGEDKLWGREVCIYLDGASLNLSLDVEQERKERGKEKTKQERRRKGEALLFYCLRKVFSHSFFF